MNAYAELHRVAIPLHEPFRISSGSVEVKESVIVELSLDGVAGFGEASPMPGAFYSPETPDSSWRELEQRLVPFWLANPSAHPEELAARLEEVSPDPFARAGLEGACWDLLARRLNRPLFELLGSRKRPVPSGVAIGLYETLEELVERVGRFLAEGYRRVKIKVQPGWDIEPVRAVRERFGGIPLMVDANAAYTLDDAPRLAELDRYDLMMIEQPLDYDDVRDHAALQRALRTPICLDESVHSVRAARDAIEAGACRVINIKPGRVGGHRESVRLHDLCAEHGIPVWHGGMLESGIGRAHNIHLASLPNFTLPGDIAASRRYYDPDLIEPPIEVAPDGTIAVPEGPGIGVQPVGERVDRATLRRALLEAPAGAARGWAR